jgi:hypothetical protein
MKQCYKTLFILLIILPVLTACGSEKLDVPIFTPTGTIFLTQTETNSPTITVTSTITPRPTATPQGGANLRYQGYDTTHRPWDICGIINANGTSLSKIYISQRSDYVNCPNNDHFYSAFHFSPDRSRYAYYFIGKDPNRNLYIDDALTGSNIQTLDFTQFFTNSSGPSLDWVDNKTILFIDKNTNNLNLLDVNSGAIKILGNYPSDVSSGYFQDREVSPDRQQFLLHSKESNIPALYLINFDNGEINNLIADMGFRMFFGNEWSPDSSRFAFIAFKGKELNLIIMKPDGSIINNIDSDILDTQVFWSPDGEQLTWMCGKSLTDTNICLSDKEGNNLRLFNTMGAPGWVAWSMDSKKIAYLTLFSKNKNQIHILWPESGKDQTIFSLSEDSRVAVPPYFQWSPDSKWILFPEGGRPIEKTGGTALMICNLEASCYDYLFRDSSHSGIFHAEWITTPSP